MVTLPLPTIDESRAARQVETLRCQLSGQQAAVSQLRRRRLSLTVRRRVMKLTVAIQGVRLRLRQLVDRTIAWRAGSLLLIGMLGGGIAIVAYESVLPSMAAAICSLAIAWYLVLFQSDEAVTNDRNETSLRAHRAAHELAELATQLGSAIDRRNETWGMLDQERTAIEEWRRSKEYKLRQLLSENWKAYRSVEFEQFLKRVFCELGYEVEVTRVTGDQGVDLIVKCRGRRIAVQVKGYTDAVSNAAVQEAYAGKTHYRCDACAVITNSRFTRSAENLAQSTGCQLIDENRLIDLILGRLDLFATCIWPA